MVNKVASAWSSWTVCTLPYLAGLLNCTPHYEEWLLTSFEVKSVCWLPMSQLERKSVQVTRQGKPTTPFQSVSLNPPIVKENRAWDNYFLFFIFFHFFGQGEDCPSTQDWTQCSWRDERQHKIKSHLWCLRMFLQQFELSFVTCILYWLTMSYSLYTGFHFSDFLYTGCWGRMRDID